MSTKSDTNSKSPIRAIRPREDEISISTNTKTPERVHHSKLLIGYSIKEPKAPEKRQSYQEKTLVLFDHLESKYGAMAGITKIIYFNLIFVQQWPLVLLFENKEAGTLYLAGQHAAPKDSNELLNQEAKLRSDADLTDLTKIYTVTECVIPLHVSQPFTMKDLHSNYHTLTVPIEINHSLCSDLNSFPQMFSSAAVPSHVVLAILDDDSTLVFYRLHDGIVPPPMAQAQEEALRKRMLSSQRESTTASTS